MATVKTHKGKVLDMTALKEKNKHTITVGNMKTNANGDLLGPGGKIIKTKQQLANEKYDGKRKRQESSKTALNKPLEEIVKTKPIKFVDEQTKKKKSDKETLGKYDLGETVVD